MIEPVRIGDATLYHADCMDVMAEMDRDAVDIVVTSPPYNTLPQQYCASGIHAERKTGVNKWISNAVNGYEDSIPESRYQKWMSSVVNECMRVSAGLVWVNHKPRYRHRQAIHPVRMLNFPIYTEVIWDRGISMALNCKRYAPSHESILAFGAPHYWDDALNTMMSVWRIPPRYNDDHPCPFPIEIPHRIIVSSCPPSGIVLDPFMGIGTSGVAALKNGRKFIGIEKHARFFDIACEQLRESANIRGQMDWTQPMQTEIDTTECIHG